MLAGNVSQWSTSGDGLVIVTTTNDSSHRRQKRKRRKLTKRSRRPPKFGSNDDEDLKQQEEELEEEEEVEERDLTQTRLQITEIFKFNHQDNENANVIQLQDKTTPLTTSTKMPHQHQQQRQQQQQPHEQYITRTRQDLINSGDLFRMNEKFAKEESARNQALNERHFGSSSKSLSSSSGRLSECCYSICNLALIVAAVISLVLLVRFLLDEPLYEYGEYLLGLRFYRQLIFVICILPFVLLLPLYNALSVLFFNIGTKTTTTSEISETSKGTTTTTTRKSYNSSLLRVKLAYQFLMFVLVFLALIFVTPYIRTSTVSSYIELEFRRHLKMRYESEFSYQLLDRIQDEYQCCDHMWYRANLQDKVPISCFVPNGKFDLIYDDTCPDVVGALVSTRCSLISACLFVILLALACLFAIDLVQVSSGGSSSPRRRRQQRGEYEIAADQENHNDSEPATAGIKNARDLNNLARTSDPSIRALSEQRSANGRALTETLNNWTTGGGSEEDDQDRDSMDRLRELDLEQERGVPLLGPSSSDRGGVSPQSQDDSLDLITAKPSLGESGGAHAGQLKTRDSPVLLTRADYRTIARERSQSPVFLAATNGRQVPSGNIKASPSTATTTATQLPIKPAIKSALKSSSSQQSVAADEEHHQASFSGGARRESYRRLGDDHDDFDDDDDESLVIDYTERLRKSDSLLRQKQFERKEQLRKSLQSVRFADDNNIA